MAIKIEVLTPVQSLSEAIATSTTITVLRSTSSPITTNGSSAVVSVVGHGAVGNVIPSPTTPPNPYNGMLWFQW